MREAIVRFLSARGALVQPDALAFLSSLPHAMDRLRSGLGRGLEFPLVLTLEHARELVGSSSSPPIPMLIPRASTVEVSVPAAPSDGPAAFISATPWTAGATALVPPQAPRFVAPTPMVNPFIPTGPVASFREEAREIGEDVKILLDVTGESTCEGTIDDFTRLFRDRYNRMRRLYRSKREMVGATAITKVREGQPVKIIAMVKDVKETPNGHRILEVEDDTGETVVLAPKSERRLIELADTVLLDEVVGISGKMSQGRKGRSDLVILEELVRPDIPREREPRRGGPGSVAFVSDVHVGAATFLADAWDSFIAWLGSRTRGLGEPASDIRHLVINGDLVDGVGVYPGQEKELQLGDVFEQYREAARTLAELPSDLRIFILPGNHDAVRPAEPQPAFPQPIRDLFPSNVTFLGNPSLLWLSGIEILCYHGVSLFDYFENLPNCNINKPIETMREMLLRRHLCPVYGGKTPLAPEHRDYLCIERVPDVFVTGHVHAAQVGEHRGVRLINASTWQEQTSYQRMLGFVPDPCKAFTVDLATLNVSTCAFDHEGATDKAQVTTNFSPRRALGGMVA